ncbi:MAG: toxic anion resistance protein [Chitinophagaceae bacterium]
MAFQDITIIDDSNLVNAENNKPVFTPEDQKKIEEFKNQIDLKSTTGIVQYGLGSQNKVSAFSDEILRQVKTQDLASAQDILLDLKSNVKEFDKEANKKSIFPFFDSIGKKIKRLKDQYTSVEKNIHQIELKLEQHYHGLMKDINILDKLFEQNQQYFKDLSLYIEAGDQKLSEVASTQLPALKAEAESSNDQAKIQEYKDLQQQLERFEKKLHDLKLTRMVVLQTAPQIRLIQNNSTALMEKIQSSIVNTLPLWKNQMILTLGIAHSQQALAAQKAVTDATNELLRKNSEILKQSTIEIAKETERGIVDIETITTANNNIISTIDEVIRIQQEGREKRKVVEVELLEAENQLKNKILRNG